ncbi:MAG: MMPL family transporter [Deltaproteobacteria bacterium]|nr:MMPL family transporter [Deltaproteobacteria bacterium]
MQKLMRFSYNHPWLVIIFLAVVLTLAVFRIPGLRIDPSAEGMMIRHDPARHLYEETVKSFGTDKISVIFIRDDKLFTPEKLKLLDDLVFDLENVPGVTRVESLFSVKDFRNDEGYLNSAPLIDSIPETEEEAKRIKRNAMRNPVVAGRLISKNGKATAIRIFIEPYVSTADFYKELTGRIERIIRPLDTNFQRIFQQGNPHLRTVISDMMVQDQCRLVPLSILVLFLALILSTRSLSGAVLPLMTSGTSIIFTLGFMSVTGIPFNILTIIVPSLIIVIGSTEDIHLLSEYSEGIRLKNARDLAVEFMISKMGTVVMVTALTTFFGFLSICVNKITILRQFGMAASFGLFVNPLITGLIAPVYFRYFGTRGIKSNARKVHREGGSFFDSLAGTCTRLVSTRKRAVLFIFFGFTAVIGAFSFRVQLNNDILGVFRKDSLVIRQINEMGRELAGAQIFFIRISSGHEGIFKDPKNLAQIAAIQEFIRKQGLFDKSLSVVDFLKLINREMHGGDPAGAVLPLTVEQVSQYLLFLQDEDLERYTDPDFSEVNIVVSHNLNSSYEQKKAIEGLRAFIERRLNPHFIYAFTGESILTLRAADAIATGQSKSIALLLIIIFIVMSVMFLNVKAGLLSLVPNILPIIIYFGVMGIFSIPLNIGTAMVAAVAIGIVVDDTIHFMTRYNSEMHRLKDQGQAMQVCLEREIRPIFATSIALALGFAVLALSNFVSIIHFGVLSALVMVVAFFGDVLVTPILLSSTRLLTLWDMFSLHLRKEVIEQSEFFRDMRPWQIKKIVLLGRIREAKAGEHVFREWDEGDSMSLILEGRAHAYSVQKKTGNEVSYAQFSPGDVFGEICMLDTCPRSANVRATTDIKYVEITRDDFQRLHMLYPHIASKAFRNLARILGHRLVISDWMYLEKKVNN